MDKGAHDDDDDVDNSSSHDSGSCEARADIDDGAIVRDSKSTSAAREAANGLEIDTQVAEMVEDLNKACSVNTRRQRTLAMHTLPTEDRGQVWSDAPMLAQLRPVEDMGRLLQGEKEQ